MCLCLSMCVVLERVVSPNGVRSESSGPSRGPRRCLLGRRGRCKRSRRPAHAPDRVQQRCTNPLIIACGRGRAAGARGWQGDDACMQERVTADGGRLGLRPSTAASRGVSDVRRARVGLIVAVMRHTSLPPGAAEQALIMIPYARYSCRWVWIKNPIDLSVM